MYTAHPQLKDDTPRDGCWSGGTLQRWTELYGPRAVFSREGQPCVCVTMGRIIKPCGK